MRYAPEASASCGMLLVVETRSKALALRVAWEDKSVANTRARDVWTPEPYVAAIIKLDPRRSQIVIARHRGAANVFVSFVDVVKGKLIPLSFRPREYANELSLFGTVGTGVANARCRRGGPLIVIGAGPTTYSGKRWYFTRAEYRLARHELREVRSSTMTSSEARIEAIARREGVFDAQPFKSCVIARGRRL